MLDINGYTSGGAYIAHLAKPPLHQPPGNPPQSPTKIYLITPQGSHSHSLGQPPRYNRNYSRHAATLFRELRVGGFVTRQFIGKALEFQTELAAKAKLRRFMQSAPFGLVGLNLHDGLVGGE